MALPKFYGTNHTAGAGTTASVANGSTTVTGIGTAWLNTIKAGDRFGAADQLGHASIESVESNTALTLTAPWPGTSLTDDDYEIAITYDGPEFQLRVRELLENLTLVDSTTTAATRSALKEINPTSVGAPAVVILSESGWEGVFVWRSGDYSALVAGDTDEHTYIESDTVDASSGAWVRTNGYPFINDVDSTGRFGMNNAGGIFLRDVVGAADSGYGTLRVQAEYDYVGGTPGWVSSPNVTLVTVRDGPEDFVWGALVAFENYATAGENTAFYSQMRKRATGNSWGATVEIDDLATNDPASGIAVGLEVTFRATNTGDVDYQRVGVNIAGHRSSASGQAEVGRGFWVSSVGDVMRFRRTFTNDAPFTDAVFHNSGDYVDTGDRAALLLDEGSADIGIDLREASYATNVALGLAEGQRISFVADGAKSFRYSSGTLAYMSSGVDVFGVSDSGDLGLGTSVASRRLHSQVNDATNNGISYAARLTHTTSGTPANGIGVGLEFDVETTAGNNVGATIYASARDVTSGSEDFDLYFNLMAAGAAAAKKFEFASTGALGIGLSGHPSIIGLEMADASEVQLKMTGGAVDFRFVAIGPSNAAVVGTYSNHGVVFYQSGIESVRLETSGHLGVGTGYPPDRRLHAEQDDSTDNAVTEVFRITHTTSGTPANGIGVGMEFEVEGGGGNKVGMALETVATDVTSASEDFDFLVKLMTGGSAAAEKFRIKSTGEPIWRPPASAAALGTNGEVTMQLTSNTSLTFKARGSDGTTRSGSITLS